VATHLSELKLLPFTNPFVRGASFEFDPVSLQPTFKLVMDAIGKSHAIEVAERLGLSEELLIKARELMNYVQPHSQLIARIEEERKFLREEKERVSSLREEYERKLRELEEEREKILSSAREEAMSFLMGIQEKVEEIVSAKVTKKEKRAEWRKLWEEIRGEQGVVFQIGDRVRLKTLSREGIVVDIKGERIVIEVEGKKMQVPFGELELSPKKKSEEVEAQPYVPQSIIMKDVNLRGMTVEEALYEIDRELDRASLEGIGKLRLIHGKGKGILRKAIWEFLRGHPLVKDFRLGEVWEGSYGTTIVTLK
ncbi:MAG: Smr/MutS family protein, partial [Candidatus Bathyarchaeia archaeon]